MRSFAVKFLVLTLCSFNGYAAPFNGGPGGGRIGPDIRPNIRPDIRPGERGSNIQEALGSSQNQYSPLNPGSNQSVFLLNNFISQQLLNDGPGGTTDISFNPINPLPGGPFERDLQSETLPLVERDLGSNFILMPPPKPFASKVAKSRVDGLVFVKNHNPAAGFPSEASGVSYVPGIGYGLGALLQFKMHKDDPTNIPIASPVGLLFIAAALLFLPAILDLTNSNPPPTGSENSFGSANKNTNLLNSPEFVSAQKVMSTQMLNGGLTPKEAEKISQALILMWAVGIAAGVKEFPASTQNQMTELFKESCADCSLQMINAAIIKSRSLVLENPRLRLSRSEMNTVVKAINTSVANEEKLSQNVLEGGSSKQLFIKTLQGKTITLGVSQNN